MRKDCLSIQAWTAKKSDFWTVQKQIRIKDIQLAIVNYLQDGYEIVDAPTIGTINLTALTITGKKALVVWRDAPTGTITINNTDTLYDSVGILDSVVILGVQLDASNQPENPDFYKTPITINLTGDAVGMDYGDKLTLKYLYMTLTTSVTYYRFRGINVLQNIILINARNMFFYSSEFSGNKIFLYDNNLTGELLIYSKYKAINVLDNYFIHRSTYWQSLGIKSSDGYPITMQNNYFHGIGLGTGRIGIVSLSTSADIVNIYNNLLENCRGDYGNCFSDEINYIFVKNSSLTSGTSKKNIFIPWNGRVDQGEIYSGNDVLDIDAIEDTNNYSLLEAFFWDSRQSIRKSLATITRNGFEHEFQENVEVGLEHKNTGDEYYRLIHETEMEEVLVNDSAGPMYIKNLTIYENGGTEYDYRNDQSFLIIARDSSGNVAVFGFINERLYETVFTDVWPDTVYTIEFCFSGKRMSENTKLRNVNTDDNSPISGSLDTQDMTSAVIIR